MMPLSALRMWTLGLVGLGITLLAAYLAWDWYQYSRDDAQLYWAIGLAVFSLLGRLVSMPLLGFGQPPPRLLPVDSPQLLRPDGTTIRVKVLRRGTGPVTVLTHGWTLDSSIWSYAQHELPADSEIIAWDLRGLGDSSKSPAKDYSIETMAADLAAVVGLAGDRPVVLVGHSIGGMICQTFCRLFPDQLGLTVVAMALVDTTYTNPLRTALLAPVWSAIQKPIIEPLLHLTKWLSPLVWLMNVQGYFNGTTQWTTRFTSCAGKQTWGQIDHASRLSAFASPDVTARGFLAMLRFDEASTIAKLKLPVAVIAGANDRITRPLASRWIAERLQHGSLSLPEPGGHLSVMERHEAVNAEIAKLIRNVPLNVSTA